MRIKTCILIFALIVFTTTVSYFTYLRKLNLTDRYSTAAPPPFVTRPVTTTTIMTATSCESSVQLSCGHCVRNPLCAYCVTTRLCVSRTSVDISCPSGDVEVQSCPAILLHKFTKTTFRVLHVGSQKGGPEALVQLFLGLHAEGFPVTLDTRKKQVGGNVKSHFTKAYATEFASAPAMRWFYDYKEWVLAGKRGDVLISTETWPCMANVYFHTTNGVNSPRQFNYHLTIQHRRNTYDVSKFYIPRADPYACSAIAHTHFMAKSFLNISHNAAIIPYITPTIVNRSMSKPWRQHKRNVVLFDGDCGLKESDFIIKNGGYELVRMSGMKPEEVYKWYEVAKVAVDLSLPGAERMTLEASLFDVIIIVDNDMNGASVDDFPIPDVFRIPKRNLKAMNDAIHKALDGYPSYIPQYKAMRQNVLQQRTLFHRSIRHYFSDSAHFVVDTCNAKEVFLVADVAVLIVSILLNMPFATIQVLSNREILPSDVTMILNEHYQTASIAFGPCTAPIIDDHVEYVFWITNSFSRIAWMLQSDTIRKVATALHQHQHHSLCVQVKSSSSSSSSSSSEPDVFVAFQSKYGKEMCATGVVDTKSVVTVTTENKPSTYLCSHSLFHIILQRFSLSDLCL